MVRHAEGRKQRAKISGGHFVAHLVEHFELITKESLEGLTVIVQDQIIINMDELIVAAKATQADQEILEEGVRDDPAPIQ
nr:hypothetical protein [Tanacetum cinerariifolium]